MKTKALLFLVVVMVVLINITCCKKNDNNDPVPAEKKKYAWVAGYQDSTGYGMILFTPDAGETWQRQGEGSVALQGIDLSDIWAVDENNVWACGSDNTILKTIDGGQNWTRVQAPANLTDAKLSSIGIVNKTNIWIAGSYGTTGNGVVSKSTDNGNTWTMLDTTFFHKNTPQGIWVISPEKAYVAGASFAPVGIRGFIAYTLDGGTTWDSIIPANDFNKWEWIGVVSSGNTIVVYGGKAKYIISTDGGGTWKNDSVPHTGGVDGADINDLIMLDPQTWWGAFDLGNIYITNDGGTSWTQQPSPVEAHNSFLVGIDNWDRQLALIVSFDFIVPPISPILKTDNGGASWETKHTVNSIFGKVSFIKD